MLVNCHVRSGNVPAKSHRRLDRARRTQSLPRSLFPGPVCAFPMVTALADPPPAGQATVLSLLDVSMPGEGMPLTGPTGAGDSCF